MRGRRNSLRQAYHREVVYLVGFFFVSGAGSSYAARVAPVGLGKGAVLQMPRQWRHKGHFSPFSFGSDGMWEPFLFLSQIGFWVVILLSFGGGFEPALQEMRKQTRRDLSLSSKVCIFLAFFLPFFLYPSVLPLPRPIRK